MEGKRYITIENTTFICISSSNLTLIVGED